MAAGSSDPCGRTHDRGESCRAVRSQLTSVGPELLQRRNVYRNVIHQYWAREMNKLRVIVFAPLLSGALCGCVATQACRVKSCANDAQITANIQSLLDQRSEFKPPNFVYVKTVNHVVYLTGQVNTDL